MTLAIVAGLFASACGSTSSANSGNSNSGAKATGVVTNTSTPANNKAGDAKKVDVVTTASGLQYQDIVVGTGASPEKGKVVVVHYTGWLANGTKFDSSKDRGQPFSFQLGMGSVIKGWDEGVASMKVGGTRKLIIPPALAYGSSGAGGVIPPNATLTFEVELLQIK